MARKEARELVPPALVVLGAAIAIGVVDVIASRVSDKFMGMSIGGLLLAAPILVAGALVCALTLDWQRDNVAVSGTLPLSRGKVLAVKVAAGLVVALAGVTVAVVLCAGVLCLGGYTRELLAASPRDLGGEWSVVGAVVGVLLAWTITLATLSRHGLFALVGAIAGTALTCWLYFIFWFVTFPEAAGPRLGLDPVGLDPRAHAALGWGIAVWLLVPGWVAYARVPLREHAARTWLFVRLAAVLGVVLLGLLWGTVAFVYRPRPELLTSADEAARLLTPTSCQASPDGKVLLLQAAHRAALGPANLGRSAYALWGVDLTSGRLRRLVANLAEYGEWSPDMTHVVFGWWAMDVLEGSQRHLGTIWLGDREGHLRVLSRCTGPAWGAAWAQSGKAVAIPTQIGLGAYDFGHQRWLLSPGVATPGLSGPGETVPLAWTADETSLLLARGNTSPRPGSDGPGGISTSAMQWDLVALELATGSVREVLPDATTSQPTPVGPRHVVLSAAPDQPTRNDLRTYDVTTGQVRTYPGVGRPMGWPGRATAGVLPVQTVPPHNAPRDAPRSMSFVDLAGAKVLSTMPVSALGGANRALTIPAQSFDGQRFVVWALQTLPRTAGQPTNSAQCGYWLVDAATGKAQYLAAPVKVDRDHPLAPGVAKLQPILPRGAEPLGWASDHELVVTTTGRDVQVFDLSTRAMRLVTVIPGKDKPREREGNQDFVQ